MLQFRFGTEYYEQDELELDEMAYLFMKHTYVTLIDTESADEDHEMFEISASINWNPKEGWYVHSSDLDIDMDTGSLAQHALNCRYIIDHLLSSMRSVPTLIASLGALTDQYDRVELESAMATLGWFNCAMEHKVFISDDERRSLAAQVGNLEDLYKGQ